MFAITASHFDGSQRWEFPKTDHFRVCSRMSCTGKRSSSGEWFELVSGEQADMNAEWYQQVVQKGYLKGLTLSESEELEWCLDYELVLKASASYKLFKQRYKNVYGKQGKKKNRKKKTEVSKVENPPEVLEVEEVVNECAAPEADEEKEDEEEEDKPRKRQKRSDEGKSRNKITNLRVATNVSCQTTRQIKHNGKWHDLDEVCAYCLFFCLMFVCVGQTLACCASF